jgi:hypothetical protein
MPGDCDPVHVNQQGPTKPELRAVVDMRRTGQSSGHKAAKKKKRKEKKKIRILRSF